MGIGRALGGLRKRFGGDDRQVQLAGEADMYGLDSIGGDGQKAGGLAVTSLHQTELGQVEESAVLRGRPLSNLSGYGS